jgi:hypothetical protein
MPVACFLSAFLIGGIHRANDFEFGTISEYRFSPIHPVLILSAHIVRLTLGALLASSLVLLLVGCRSGVWPSNYLWALCVLLPISIIGGGLGMATGLLLRRTLPTLVIALCLTLGNWIVGSGFSLASGFGGVYEQLSRFSPNQYTVELLFPLFYGPTIGNHLFSWGMLIGFCIVSLGVLVLVYHQQVTRQH